MKLFQHFLSFDRTVQVLLTNQLAITLGFFMLVPFLPNYLAHELVFAAWMVGLVVGVRNFSQQGMFLLGGTLSDRIGYRPVIFTGCMLRAVGFALFGLSTSFAGVLLAAVLSGLAGALFSPAMRAYLAVESGERRLDAFSLFNVCTQTGLLFGPLVGVGLVGMDFRLVCFISAAIFAALSVVQVFYLPARQGGQAGAGTTVLGDWREALSNRAFVLFALGGLGYFTLYNQIYLSLPLEVRRLTGHELGVALVFFLSGVMTIALQTRVTELCKQRWRPVSTVIVGMGLMGVAFTPLFLAAPFLPLVAPAPGLLAVAAAAGTLTPILLSTALLSLGMMVCLPFINDLIPSLGGGRLVGTYFGLYYLVTGLGSTVGNVGVGLAFDVGQEIGLPGLPWLLLMLLGASSAVAIGAMDRLGLLRTQPVRPAAE